MATAVYNRHFNSITLFITAAGVVVNDSVVPDITLSRTLFQPTATVTLAPGTQTLTGANETNWLAWKAANITNPFILNAILN